MHRLALQVDHIRKAQDLVGVKHRDLGVVLLAANDLVLPRGHVEDREDVLFCVVYEMKNAERAYRTRGCGAIWR